MQVKKEFYEKVFSCTITEGFTMRVVFFPSILTNSVTY